jgi:hypothetical protein
VAVQNTSATVHTTMQLPVSQIQCPANEVCQRWTLPSSIQMGLPVLQCFFRRSALPGVLQIIRGISHDARNSILSFNDSPAVLHSTHRRSAISNNVQAQLAQPVHRGMISADISNLLRHWHRVDIVGSCCACSIVGDGEQTVLPDDCEPDL